MSKLAIFPSRVRAIHTWCWNSGIVIAINCFVIALFIGASALPSFAHSPHDDVFDVRISPNFHHDHSAFAIVRSNFFASRDGGNTWQRMVKGLDHKHLLFTFDIAGDGKTIYLASFGDGIFRSSDAGHSWGRVNNGLGNLALDVVAVAPQSPGLVFAAGVKGGLFRTQNGGDSWQRIKGPFGKITALAFDPHKRDLVLLGDHLGQIYLSRDGGAGWGKLYNAKPYGAITCLALTSKGSKPATIMAGTSYGKILESEDGGKNFSVTPVSSLQQPIQSIAFSPGFPGTGVAFASTWQEGVYVSDASGKAWERTSQGLTRNRQSKLFGRPSFGRISISPQFAQDRTAFLAGYNGLFRTRNGGESWQEMTTLSPLNLVGIGISPDYPHDATLAVSEWLWGAFLSKNGGRSWHPINNGAVDYHRKNGLTRLFNPVFAPAYPKDPTLFTTTWYRLLKSSDGGNHWRQIAPLNTPRWTATNHASTIALSPDFAKDGTMFLGTHRGLLLASSDGGETFSILRDLGDPIGSLAISPTFGRDRTVFVADSKGVYRSRDAGKDWAFTPLVDPSLQADFPVSPAYPPRQAPLWKQYAQLRRAKDCAVKLALSPAFAVDQTGFAGTPNGLFKTDDGGQSWHRLQGNPFTDDAYIETVAVSPDYGKDHLLLVSVRGAGLYRSSDGGESFVAIAPRLIDEQILFAHYVGMFPRFPTIVFSPGFARDHTIYAISGAQLFKTADGGNTWVPLKPPSPSLMTKASVWLQYRLILLKRQGKYYLFHSNKARVVGVLMLLAGGAGFALGRRSRTNR